MTAKLTEDEYRLLDYAVNATDCGFEDVVEAVERIISERGLGGGAGEQDAERHPSRAGTETHGQPDAMDPDTPAFLAACDKAIDDPERGYPFVTGALKMAMLTGATKGDVARALS